jgi:hypothetical protein
MEVYNRMHRQGVSLLTLVLPDGSRSLIPAAWTDMDGTPSTSPFPSAVIGSLPDLLRTRKIIDSLLCKLDALKQIPAKEERKRAKATSPLARRGTAEHLGRSRPRDTKGGYCHPVKADRTDGSSKTPGGKR